jgi:CDP-glycerol glycerophosphotransferase
VYLNTWHGTPVKTAGNAATGRKDYDFSNIDFFCVSGSYEEKLYIRDLKIKPTSIIRTGLPRNDDLYHVTDEETSTIKAKLSIPSDRKVALYAPTWRDSKDNGKTYLIAPPINMELWKEKLDSDYILLLRTHPYTTKMLGIQFDDFVRNFSDYTCINDLLKISDVLISDYSATIFDYSILERPIICFGYDYESYRQERGLYLDLEKEIPGGIVKTENEVLERLLSMDIDKEQNDVRKFRNKYIEYGGKATETCAKLLLEGRKR